MATDALRGRPRRSTLRAPDSALSTALLQRTRPCVTGAGSLRRSRGDERNEPLSGQAQYTPHSLATVQYNRRRTHTLTVTRRVAGVRVRVRSRRRRPGRRLGARETKEKIGSLCSVKSVSQTMPNKLPRAHHVDIPSLQHMAGVANSRRCVRSLPRLVSLSLVISLASTCGYNTRQNTKAQPRSPGLMPLASMPPPESPP